MPHQALAVAQVAATYAGTVMGAGFASGQEMLQFFVAYGSMGLVGIAVAGILFAWLGTRVLELSYQLGATGYHHVFNYVCGPKVGPLLNWFTALFLYVVLTIMLAGASTVFRDQFGLDYNLGLLLIALLVTITTLCGVRGITTANMVITPILLISTVAIGLYSFYYHGVDNSLIEMPVAEYNKPAPHWLLSSLLYVSYNLVIGSTVLVPLGSSIKSSRVRVLGGLLGGVILAVLALFVAATVMLHYPHILAHEVPMLYISSIQYDLIHQAFAVTLLAAMYTTAIASVFGCLAKLQALSKLGRLSSILIIMGIGLIGSQFGFANLIASMFPLFGYATIWFTLRLMWLALRGS